MRTGDRQVMRSTSRALNLTFPPSRAPRSTEIEPHFGVDRHEASPQIDRRRPRRGVQNDSAAARVASSGNRPFEQHRRNASSTPGRERINVQHEGLTSFKILGRRWVLPNDQPTRRNNATIDDREICNKFPSRHHLREVSRHRVEQCGIFGIAARQLGQERRAQGNQRFDIRGRGQSEFDRFHL
jgi:hypothetical protein